MNEQANRVRGLSAGDIGAFLLLAQKIELEKEIDRTLHLLKRHLPYHESDHVLNIAFNILAGGTRIEHLELRRNGNMSAAELVFSGNRGKAFSWGWSSGCMRAGYAEGQVIEVGVRMPRSLEAAEQRKGSDA